METGKIKRVVTERGFGFIRRPGDRDLFFHVSECLFSKGDFLNLCPGDSVQFEVGPGKKGEEAKGVMLVSPQ
jgi:CspA family cold shock protein